MSLTSRIQALTAYANEVTGESDTTLADAVATLAQGYGQGGGGSAKVYTYEFTADENHGSSNKLNMTLDPVNPDKYLISVYVDGSPEADSDIYIFKSYVKVVFPAINSTVTAIIRPNGTTGTDNTMASFTPSTGGLSLGGSYGQIKAGLLYHIYLITEYD